MEMKEVLCREGRDAKNLVAYQICAGDNSLPKQPDARRPPIAPSKSPNLHQQGLKTPRRMTNSPERKHSKQNGPRVRSASTGRDKKSELQARYWALLFGNLQRAVNEIYQTVECYENISSCQEAILVLENYVRDFKALSEWFKVSWDYESRPVQQRPHSLAWEVRKSNPAPRVRAKSLSSPIGSGKSSPCFCCNSGKISPCCGNIDVRRLNTRIYDHSMRGPLRVSVRELFASSKKQNVEQVVGGNAIKKETKESEKEQSDVSVNTIIVSESEIEHIHIPNHTHQWSQTDLEDDHLTLADLLEKQSDEIRNSNNQNENSNQFVYEQLSCSEDLKPIDQISEPIAYVNEAILMQQHQEMMLEQQQEIFLGQHQDMILEQQRQSMLLKAHQGMLLESHHQGMILNQHQHQHQNMLLEQQQYMPTVDPTMNYYKAIDRRNGMPPVEIMLLQDVNIVNIGNDEQMYREQMYDPNIIVEAVPVVLNHINIDYQQNDPTYNEMETGNQNSESVMVRDIPAMIAQEPLSYTIPAAIAKNPYQVKIPKNEADYELPQTTIASNTDEEKENKNENEENNVTPTNPSDVNESNNLKDTTKYPTLPTTQTKKPIESAPLNKVTTSKTSASLSSDNKAAPLKYSSVLNRSPAIRNAPLKTGRNVSTTSKVVATANNSVTSTVAKPTTAQNVSKRQVNATTVTTSNYGKPQVQTAAGNRVNTFRNKASMYGTNRPTSKREYYGPNNVAARMSNRSRTMIDLNVNAQKTNPNLNTNKFKRPNPKINSAVSNLSNKSSKEDVGSSSSTLKASNERLPTTKTNGTTERHSEPKNLGAGDGNDGWFTVKNRRRSSMHWANRFDQPTGYASLPTLALHNNQKDTSPKPQPQPKTTAQTTTSNNTVPMPQRLANRNVRQTGKQITPAHQQQQAKKVPTVKQQADVNDNKTVATCTQKTINSQAVMNKEKNGRTLKATKAPIQKSTTKAIQPRPELKQAKAKVNSLPLNKTRSDTSTCLQKTSINSSTNSVNDSRTTRQNIIKRQKSDITGLKMTSLHKEYMRSEKSIQRKLQDTHLQNGSEIFSSTETVVEASTSASSLTEQSATEPATVSQPACEQQKINIKIQTNRDFSKTIGDLYESIAQTNKFSAINGFDDNEDITASSDETDEDQRKLVEEQESLERQIRELESTEIDVDTETDETDCDVILDAEHEDPDNDYVNKKIDDASSVIFVDFNDDESMTLEMRYHALLSEMSGGEREEALATLQAYVSRHPGRAQELHQKLSSPSRRRSLQETLKKYQAKQARAQEKREMLKKEKALKIQHLLARVEDVKSAKAQLIEKKRLKMEGRLQRAAENREQYLRQIIEKAHDEEKKLKEINFIKNIEAQNKRLDLLESSKDAEGRLQDLEQERQKRLEEKAAKEAAVERRRQELEKERQKKLERLNETRLEKEQRIGKMQEQKERQRQALAREKAQNREERLLALQAQQQQSTEELQRKILQKQQESARRHEENIEQIRQRALELAVPRNIDEQGNPRTDSDESPENHDDGEHSSTVSDLSNREHTRSYKKKMKKLKIRLTQSTEKYLEDRMQPLPPHLKRESQVPKHLNLVTKGGGNQGLERSLSHLNRIITKGEIFDYQCFLLMDGLTVITTNVISKYVVSGSDISKKSAVTAVQLYRNACNYCPQIARHALMTNSFLSLFDSLIQSLQIPEEKSPYLPVELSTELMLACTVVMAPSYTKKNNPPNRLLERLPDILSYAVLTGLIEILSKRCLKIKEPVENQQSVVLSLLATIGLIARFADICPPGPSDQTRFLTTARSTEIFGTMSMLYACVVPCGEIIPPRTVSLAAATFHLVVAIAALDLVKYQELMSAEPLSLKFFDVVSVLLKYCGPHCSDNETHVAMLDIVAAVGFFCINNRRNQDVLVSEQCSIIFKYLTKLPSRLDVVVYPCLVALTHQNKPVRAIVGREFDLKSLDDYSKSDAAKKNVLLKFLK